MAFELIHDKYVPIHLANNLRLFCDRHSFMELVLKLYDRQIALRIQNRIHYVRNGSCSCSQ